MIPIVWYIWAIAVEEYTVLVFRVICHEKGDRRFLWNVGT
jgi:hypothetical protein